MSIRLHLFGDVSVERNDQVIQIGSARQRALLALLALAPRRSASVEAIIEGLWGDAPPATARKNVQVLVSGIRRVVGVRDIVLTREDGYSLGADVQLDVDVLVAVTDDARNAVATGRALAAAASDLAVVLEATTGAPLGGLDAARWAIDDVRRLEQARLDARALLAEVRLELGDHDRVQADVDELVDEYPSLARLHHMRALASYRSGRQADALDACRTALAAGTDDDESLRALERMILQHDVTLRSSARNRSGLPSPPVPAFALIGREAELAAVTEALASSRVVTIVGTGGAGKTRLAQEVARDCPHGFEEVAWIDLAPVRERGSLITALLRALGVTGGSEPVAAIIQSIGSRNLLVVLDNLEHVLHEVPQIEHIVRSCPRVAFLVTSRIELGISAECQIPLAPFRLPTDISEAHPDELARLDAIRLFIERSESAGAPMLLDARAMRVIAQVCATVDGLPLGIELAAARTTLLSPDAILKRLDRRFDLLRHRDADRSDRRRSLHGVVAWSYDLLSAFDQRSLRVLALFPAGCRTADFQGVAGLEDHATAVETLERLGANSLVIVERSVHGGRRWRLLETIAAFARDRLVDDEGAGEFRSRFVERMRSKAAAANTINETAEQELVEEWANVRAAFDWALSRDAPRAADIFKSLDRYLHTRGSMVEGDAMGRLLVERGAEFDDRRRADVLGLAGRMATYRGDGLRGQELLSSSIEIARRCGERQSELRNLIWEMERLRWSGDLPGALDLAMRALSIARAINDTWLEAQVIAQQGFTYVDMERLDLARPKYLVALDMFEQLGDEFWVGNIEANILTNDVVTSHDASLVDELAACAERLGLSGYTTFAAHVDSFRLRSALEVGKFREAADMADDLVARVRRTGEALLLLYTLSCASVAYAASGRRDDARSAAVESLRLAVGSQFMLVADYSIGVLACVTQQDDPELARWMTGAIDFDALDGIYRLDKYLRGMVLTTLDMDEHGIGREATVSADQVLDRYDAVSGPA